MNMETYIERLELWKKWMGDGFIALQKEAGLRLEEILADKLRDILGYTVDNKTRSLTLRLIEESIDQWENEMICKGYDVTQRIKATTIFRDNAIDIQFPKEVIMLQYGDSKLLHIPFDRSKI